MASAIEFSFLLGLITLSAATVLDLAKHGGELVDKFGVVSPLVGAIFAFITAFAAVKWMVDYLSTHSLKIFGYYRISIGVIAIFLLITGAL